MICTNAAHYDAQSGAVAVLDELTRDPRLHVADETACSRRWRTIVVDPPWSFSNFNPFAYSKANGRDSVDRQEVLKRQKYQKGAASSYSCMTLEEITDIALGEWAEPNAHLYVWVPGAFVSEAISFAKIWGFEYKQLLVWRKPRLGLGMYYRNTAEFVVFAIRGSLKVARRNVGTVFEGEQGRHSEKPQAFYDMVETMSPGPYLDVFARKQRMGWDVAGNEVYSAIPELQ